MATDIKPDPNTTNPETGPGWVWRLKNPDEKAEWLKEAIAELRQQLNNQQIAVPDPSVRADDTVNAMKAQIEELKEQLEISTQEHTQKIETLEELGRSQAENIQRYVQNVENLQTEVEAAARRSEQASGWEGFEVLKCRISKLEGHLLPALHAIDEEVAALQFELKEAKRNIEEQNKKYNGAGKQNVELMPRQGRQQDAHGAEHDDHGFGSKRRKVGEHGSPNTTALGYGNTSRFSLGDCDIPRPPIGSSPHSRASPVYTSTETEKRKNGHFHDIRTMPIYICTGITSSRIVTALLHAARVPAAVHDMVQATLRYAETGRRFTFGTRTIGRCVHTVFQSPLPVWPKDHHEEAACRLCTTQRYACLLVTKEMSLVLLPLASELRGGAVMNDEGYWRLNEGLKAPREFWGA